MSYFRFGNSTLSIHDLAAATVMFGSCLPSPEAPDA
jgi:hypothetical protein